MRTSSAQALAGLARVSKPQSLLQELVGWGIPATARQSGSCNLLVPSGLLRFHSLATSSAGGSSGNVAVKSSGISRKAWPTMVPSRDPPLRYQTPPTIRERLAAANEV
jgi:hypothetical protein